MVADPSKYEGREQAYVKHYFLESYLERLIHKTASAYNEVAYVDGFSGPWQSSGEDFGDTSFAIALAALETAKESWKKLGRDVRMSAFLVEQSPIAYKKLREIGKHFPNVNVHTYNNDFVVVAPRLLAEIPPGSFGFIFIDPKGWRISMRDLEPLLSRDNSEVVFNFMFEFVNRAASMREPVTIAGLDQLMPLGSWRDRLESAASAEERKEILVTAFSQALRDVGDYQYVAEIPVFRPLKNRPLYSLIFGTRRSPGIEVFRDCQIATLREQDAIRKATKHKQTERLTGQSELFGADVAVRPSEISEYLETERQAAEKLLIELVPKAPNWVRYGNLWPQVLACHAVRRTQVNSIAGHLRKTGVIDFENWETRKRVPDDNYRASRPSG